MSEETTTTALGPRRDAENVASECNISTGMQSALQQFKYQVQDFEVRDDEGNVVQEYSQCFPVQNEPRTHNLLSPEDLGFTSLTDLDEGLPQEGLVTRNNDGEAKRTLDVVTVTGQRLPRLSEVEPDFSIEFDEGGTPLYETTPKGDVRFPIGERFSVEIPRESPFRNLDNIGIRNLCSEQDVESGIGNTIGGYFALAEQAVSPSAACASVNAERAEELRQLQLLGVDVLGQNSAILSGRGPDGRGYDNVDVDDVMDVKGCTKFMGADACAGVSEDGGGVSISRRW